MKLRKEFKSPQDAERELQVGIQQHRFGLRESLQAMSLSDVSDM